MIYREYGSRRGFAGAYWHRMLYYLGHYRRYRHVDWRVIERLVFVCKGNICRSPYAEAVARSIGVEAVSCGLDTIAGAPAHEQAVRTARARGYGLEHHRTTPIAEMELGPGDLLVAMEPWQADRLRSDTGGNHATTLSGLWIMPVLPYIHDPYGTCPEYFDRCFSRIEQSVHEIANKIS